MPGPEKYLFTSQPWKGRRKKDGGGDGEEKIRGKKYE